MGVYEVAYLSTPGMHWQQERHGMLAAAYDPSRDLSPNLPCQESSDSGSGCSSASGSSTSCCKSEFTPCRDCSPEPTSKEEVVCDGCRLRITDRYYLYAVDRKWHASCLQCSQCRLPLDGEVTCYSRDGSIFCKKDYYRLFCMRRCARCQAAISSTELVMRARELVFHVHCFSCAVCSALLTKGDTFGMRDGAVFCRVHYAELPPLSPYPPEPPFPHEYHHPRLTPPLPPGPPGPPDPVKMPNAFFPNGAPAPRQKGRPRKRKPKDLEGMTANLDLNAESYLDVAFGPGTPGGMPGANGSHHTRTKRMRTSFKHHQLRTMKSYFAINHNPDAKDLKQLSQKTGLPKRVLQVWFQNARAKWRRMVLKQEGGGGGPGGGLKDKLTDSGLEGYHHPMGPHGSPYLSPSPLECSS